MKKLLLLSAFLSISIVSMAAQADGGKVYYYSFDLTNGYWHNRDWSEGDCGKIVARFVAVHDLDCVDLRQDSPQKINEEENHHIWFFKKEQRPNTKINSCKTGVVLNKPLTDDQQASIKRHLCEKGGSKCKVQVFAKTKDISALSVSYSKGGADGPHGDPVKIGKVDHLPRFSNACVSGNFDDSWTDTAVTPDSQTFLQKIGVNPDQVRDIGLDDKAGQFWEFGFIKQQQQNQRAAPQPDSGAALPPPVGTGSH